MARGVGHQGGAFGAAISNMVADAVHKVITHALPGIHAERIRQTTGAFHEASLTALESLGPLARSCLDADVVHDVLKPVFRILAGRD